MKDNFDRVLLEARVLMRDITQAEALGALAHAWLHDSPSQDASALVDKYRADRSVSRNGPCMHVGGRVPTALHRDILRRLIDTPSAKRLSVQELLAALVWDCSQGLPAEAAEGLVKAVAAYRRAALAR